MTEPRLKTALRRHLAYHGLRTDQTTREVNAGLRQLLGRRRYTTYRAAVARYEVGATDIGEVYGSAHSLTEANLLMSLQGAVTLVAGCHIATFCVECAPRQGRVVELGCWSGTLCSFLAAQRPDLQVVGVDRLGHLIEQASRHHRQPNLSFAHWDYWAGVDPQLGKFDLLVSSLGIDFEQQGERDYGSSPLSCRRSHGHVVGYCEAWTYFHNWERVANSEAVLAVILRCGCAGHAVAILDAASDAGWSFDWYRSVRFAAGDETFPMFVFTGGDDGRRVEEDALLAWWVAHE